jgi:hypothetical protein
MNRNTPTYFVVSVALTLGLFAGPMSVSAQPAGGLRASSDQTLGGFVNPESIGCDAKGKALYAGNFGSPKFDPALKDGMGYISKLGLDGKVVEKQFLPAPGGEMLNRPKGIWVQGDRLWVTDIDVVWIFDLKTRKGRKLALPGVGFANDPAVMDNVLYISDNRNDQMIKVAPADFLNAKKEPVVTEIFKGVGVNPNGIYPMRDGMLLMVGFIAPDRPRGIYALGVSGQIKSLSAPIGRLDGVYPLGDGSLLVTDWNSGALLRWTEDGETRKLAEGFKGPADFCVIPQAGGLTVYVPDLVQSQLRIIQLRR